MLFDEKRIDLYAQPISEWGLLLGTVNLEETETIHAISDNETTIPENYFRAIASRPIDCLHNPLSYQPFDHLSKEVIHLSKEPPPEDGKLGEII